MRKFLVKNLVLLTRCSVFGKDLIYPRASRILFPSFVLGSIILTQISPSVINWYDFIILIYWLVLLWLGFTWGGIGYFKLFPVKWEELDNYQKYSWGRINPAKLNENQYKEWLILKNIYE